MRFGFPTGGAISVRHRSAAVGARSRGGRPERARRTPVNMGNQPHRDNGEGVASRPLPYPLSSGHAPNLPFQEMSDAQVPIVVFTYLTWNERPVTLKGVP